MASSSILAYPTSGARGYNAFTLCPILDTGFTEKYYTNLSSGDVVDTSLLRKIDLESGLELEIYDVSRKLAGDRWYVGFIARVEMPITFLAGHPDSPEIDIEKMKDVLGETVRFEQKRDRHYIDEKEKDALLNGLIDDFLASTLPYFSEKDFARKYTLKEYNKKLEKASLYDKMPTNK